jgi:hypothetical protein
MLNQPAEPLTPQEEQALDAAHRGVSKQLEQDRQRANADKN